MHVLNSSTEILPRHSDKKPTSPFPDTMDKNIPAKKMTKNTGYPCPVYSISSPYLGLLFFEAPHHYVQWSFLFAKAFQHSHVQTRRNIQVQELMKQIFFQDPFCLKYKMCR